MPHESEEYACDPLHAASALAAATAQLPRVQAALRAPGGPLVIGGSVDGHGFYFRMQGGSWEVAVSPHDRRHLAAWENIRFTTPIATGDELELVGPQACACPHDAALPVRALYLAVRSVRDHCRRYGALRALAATGADLATGIKRQLDAGGQQAATWEAFDAVALLARMAQQINSELLH